MTIGVIGGGPAGMMAAITAARQGAKVTLFERNDRVGKKILATGNGKCNLGNEMLSEHEYYGSSPEWIHSCLEQFDTEDTVRFFQGLGLLVKSKNGGYLYPASEQASAVLDVLRTELSVLGVEVLCECKVNKIECGNESKISIFVGDKKYLFDRVIVACGSKAAPKTGSDGSGYKLAKQLGHSTVPVVPALVQLKCSEDYLKAVAGVRADALISVRCEGKEVTVERGELQLTEYGISGIPVFQLSRRVNYLRRERHEVEVHINFLPDYSAEDYEKLCTARQLIAGDRTVEEFFTGMLHKKLMLLFIKMAGLKPNIPMEQADKRKIQCVFDLCRDWCLHVTESNSFDNAQVCAGGVSTDEITAELESKKVPGVFFAGELLDVDGRCGGYNLQWAWCSGYLAGRAAAGMEQQ